MKRRFTFFSRLAAGLLTVLLALPQSARAYYIVNETQYYTVSISDHTYCGLGSAYYNIESITSTSNATVIAPIYLHYLRPNADDPQTYKYAGFSLYNFPLKPGVDTITMVTYDCQNPEGRYEDKYIFTVEKGDPEIILYTGEPWYNYRNEKVYNNYTSGSVHIGEEFETPTLLVNILDKVQIYHRTDGRILFETTDVTADYQRILETLDTVEYYSTYIPGVEDYLKFTEVEVTTGITYESSDPTIASVDVTTGAVTPLKEGEVTITAKWEGNDLWKAAEISYSLKVEKPYGYVYLSESSLEMIEGDDFTEPKVTTAPAGLPLTYSSSNEAVATVDASTGKLTINGAGEATITVTFAGDENYYEYSTSYTLVVKERIRVNPELSFSDSWMEYYVGYENTLPTLNNPSNLPVTYTSNNTDVAQVDAATGAITPVAAGSAVITATFDGNLDYNAKSAEYSISITSALQWRQEPVFTFDDVTGDGSHSVTFDTKTNTLTMTNAVYDLTSSCPSGDPECIGEANGGFVFNRWDDDWNVVLSGTNEFICNYFGFFLGGKSITFSGEGSLRVVGLYTPVSVGICTIDGVSLVLEAKGGTVNCPNAIYFDSLTITNNGHLLAKTSSEATWCSDLSVGTVRSLVLDENISILTPNVNCVYDPDKNLYGEFRLADGSLAVEVEIGKKPIAPVPDDEETTFDFSVIGPDGSDMLSVSLGAHDSYNKDEGRLEIASTATEEDVTAALESAVPGSSAFMSLLPSSISFEVEAGEGDIEIDCQTLPGFVLKVRINGVGEASLSSTVEQYTRGKATVHYNVSQKTYVVIYLQGAPSSPAPARIIATTADDDPNAGAYIYGIKVTPKKAPSAVENVQRDNVPSTKVLREGQIYILRGDKTYTVTGQEVK